MKFERTSIAAAEDKLVGMTWSAGPWHIVMRHWPTIGKKCSVVRGTYGISLMHLEVRDLTLNLSVLRIRTRSAAIMALMWLVNKLSRADDNLDIEWRQLMRDLTGNDEAGEDATIFVSAERIGQACQELRREV